MWFLFLVFGAEISKIEATETTKKDNQELICDFRGSFLLAIFPLLDIKEVEEGCKLNFHLKRF